MSSDAYEGIRCCVSLVIFFVMIILVNKASEVSKEKKWRKNIKKEREERERSVSQFRQPSDLDRVLARKVRPERIKICTHAGRVKCRDCGKCIQCNGGYGDLSEPSHPLCYSCGYYDSYDGDD
jgi:hypothetical protein